MATLVGVYRYMFRFVGLVPKFVTRVSDAAAVAGRASSITEQAASGRSAAAKTDRRLRFTVGVLPLVCLLATAAGR